MNRCISGKRLYASQQIAEDVLIETWTRFDFTPANGPIAVYQCEDCGYYHLTSRGPMNDKLAKAIEEGRIRRGQEAARWIDKLKKK